MAPGARLVAPCSTGHVRDAIICRAGSSQIRPSGLRCLPTQCHALQCASSHALRTARSCRKLSRGAAASGGAGSTEQALRNTVEIDKLIDSLKATDSEKLPQVIAENLFSFDQKFWLRLATRADCCTSQDDRRDLEELSETIMKLVEKVVRRTEEQMNSTSDKLAELLTAAGVFKGSESGEEFVWPPKDPKAVERLRKEVVRWDKEGKMDDSFLASVTAQLRQATEKGDRPGLVAMLQKLLQLYAATRFGQRSFAVKDSGEVDHAEKLLETILQSDIALWGGHLRDGLALGGGSVSEEAFLQALELRAKRVQMRSEGGSYEQRILGEFLAEVETKFRAMVETFKAL